VEKGLSKVKVAKTSQKCKEVKEGLGMCPVRQKLEVDLEQE
jgi:hypothetical protein